MKSIGMSKIGLVRQRNEDRFYIGESFCIVTDGMGGYKGGEIASTLVVDTLAEDMQNWQTVSVEALRQAMAKANTAVFERVQATPALEGMGTTAVVAYVVGTTLYWANVGDSRLYVFHEGQLTQISTDHSMVQALYDAGELQADDMLQHPQRNVLTRAVGVGPTVDIDAGVEELAPGDRILLCSDGLTGYIEQAVIEEAFRNEAKDDRLLEDLMTLVYDQGARDNVTIVIGSID
ncbi:Stp1/IreP family PP2C-type Ser/Thr phosphatase [Veillonella sp. R32]|uniref:Stp1/IreP family PP2C-type Ser/Thr phosphatase n=1 Tax=Veillonella sp. R32 TaxID=2021312 RepID=UPI00138A3882|nr:Stp1/IreP family PP2C-type Ser/Thr phosphatase [Veillonella sp. R32]KAF1679335.1 serine/threonine protein kinase [Veillonella sp. R32]